LVLW